MKLDYLAFAAHPDDVELAMGATMAMLSAKGKKTGIVDLSRGEMGSRGTTQTREREATESAKILGLSHRSNLGLPDSLLISNRKNQLELIKSIRSLRPDTVFINAPDDRHPDHGNSSTLQTDSIFFSGLRKIETYNEDGTPQEPWRPYHIIHYMQDRVFEPSFVVDISAFFDKRLASILAFKTQFNVSDPSEEPETYISSPRFFKQIEARARHYGHMIGAEYGEPFLYHKGPIPVSDLDFLDQIKPTR